ncbi:MAG: type II toxin-antitoxin system Phd/YefM family antitoxin [Planctomycetota bacterium]|jgi:antitoxin (DNA-binding transcriptional repressor) of toxin-antitoxin stability system
MRFLNVRDLRGKSSQVWKDLREEGEMVVTNNGRPIAILSAVDEPSLEEFLTAFRQARAVGAVTSLQRRSVEKGADKLTLSDVNREIAAVRRRRSR